MKQVGSLVPRPKFSQQRINPSAAVKTWVWVRDYQVRCSVVWTCFAYELARSPNEGGAVCELTINNFSSLEHKKCFNLKLVKKYQSKAVEGGMMVVVVWWRWRVRLCGEEDEEEECTG